MTTIAAFPMVDATAGVSSDALTECRIGRRVRLTHGYYVGTDTIPE